MPTLKMPFQYAVKGLLQFVPERDYSNAERMLAATGLTPLLVNLQSKNPMRVRSVKTASHGKSRRPCIVLYMQTGCLLWDVAQPLYKRHRAFLNTF